MGRPRTNKPNTTPDTDPALNEGVGPVNEETASPEAADGGGDDTTAKGSTGEETAASGSTSKESTAKESAPKESAPKDAAADDSAADDSAEKDAPAPDSEESESADSGYDETAGIVYEVQPRGLEIFGLKGEGESEGGNQADSGEGEPTADPPTVVQPTAVQPALGEEAAATPGPASGGRATQDDPIAKLLKRLGIVAAPGGERPPLTRFRNLPMDQKMDIWRIRAMIVVAVGVVFSFIAGWQIGISLAIIAGIGDTVYRARTVEARAWAQPGTVDRATMRAQRATIRQLAAMERAGYLSLNRRPIPDSEEVIDHLVVGPTGVYAIDSEKWDRGLPIRQSNGKKLWLGPENKNDRLDHACWEAGQASERLSAKLGTEITVQPALAIYGPKISWVVLDVRGVDVFSGSELKKYLRRRARRKGLPHLSNDEIRKIYEAAGGVLPLEWRNTSTPVG